MALPIAGKLWGRHSCLPFIPAARNVSRRARRAPFYDLGKNAWLTAEAPGSEYYARQGDDGQGVSLDLGLVYDVKCDLVWGVMCNLAGTGALNVMRIDAKELKLTPVATP